MDFFQNSYYRINKRLMYYLGMWPLQTPGERHFYTSTTILLVGSLLVPQLIKVVMCLGNVDCLIRCLPILGLQARCAIRFLNCSINGRKMRTLTNQIKEDWRGTMVERTILRHYANRGRLLTVIYVAYMTLAMSMYLSLPIIPIVLDIVLPLNQSRSRIYLCETEYFVDRDHNYVYTTLHACLTIPFIVAIFVAYDTMFTVYVHHACAIFATLGARLESLGSTASIDRRSTTNEGHTKRRDETYHRIVDCIKIHKEAVEYTTLIESSGSICFLFVIGIDIMGLTLTGVMIVTNFNQLGESLRYGFFAIGEFFHLLYLCWQGQVLMEHSQHVFVDAFSYVKRKVPAEADIISAFDEILLLTVHANHGIREESRLQFLLPSAHALEAVKTSMSFFTVLLSLE